MDWAAKKEERLLKEFYEKTGIKLTTEPIFLSEWEELHADRFYRMATERPTSIIAELEVLIEEHPELGSLKNYLFSAYTFSGKKEKAAAILERTIKEHPNYVFGPTNKILNIRKKEELLKIGHLLGEPRDIREIVGYDELIHLSAFKSYQEAAAHYEMIIGESRSAIQRLESLMDLEIDPDFVNRMAKNLAMIRIELMKDHLDKKSKISRDVISKQKVYLKEQTEQAPLLTHSILTILYEVSTDSLSEEKQLEILSLPIATLIEDLEKILVDTMKRWEYFQTTEYDKDAREFTFHALYFLGALKSEKSLESVLDLLRMGENFTDFWFGNYLEEVFVPTLYILGKDQLGKLLSFAQEEGIKGFTKSLIGKVVSQVAIHQPERRFEVVQWFQNLFQTFLDQPDNDNLIDTFFLTVLVGHIIDFRGTELIPIIEALNEKGWIHDDFEGDIIEIRKLINQEYHPSELEPFPENIQEYYSGEYKNRKIKRPLDEEDRAILAQFNSKGEALVTEFLTGIFTNNFGNSDFVEWEEEDFYDDYETYDEPVKTIKRVGAKIGRNDPCPCGSGKKYKKCCLC